MNITPATSATVPASMTPLQTARQIAWSKSRTEPWYAFYVVETATGYAVVSPEARPASYVARYFRGVETS